MKKRFEIIDEVVKKLHALKQTNSNMSIDYAIDENIVFFNSCKSIYKYVLWLLKRAPKIDGKRLFEINDILPEYDSLMHRKLVEMERKQMVGLIKPIVKAISRFIINKNANSTVINFGSGGMELERQVLNSLIKRNHTAKVTIVAVDQSQTVKDIARNTLSELGSNIALFEVDELNQTLLETINKDPRQYKVILCKNNIFKLEDHFTINNFDLSYNSLFLHHLSESNKLKLVSIAKKISRNIIEYDGYIKWASTIPQTLIGWSNPIFLNAEIFSDLRYNKLGEIKSYINNTYPDSKHSFSAIGFYIHEYNKTI